MRIIYISGKRRYIYLGAGIILLAVLLLVAFWPGHFLSAVSSGFRRVPIYEVATDKAAVALSFDASWGAENTLLILDTLDSFGVKTTFFLVNIWIEDYPELTREIAARGHEIGLHSVTHPNFTSLTNEQIIRELKENAEMIQSVSGYTPRLFRPPFGDYDDRVLELVEECGFISIQWSVDSLDTKRVTA